MIDKKKIIQEFGRQKFVRRWNGQATINNLSLLEHCARVANIVDVIINKIPELEKDFDFKYRTLRYALYHDLGEIYINDIPSPAKKTFPDLASISKSIEKEILTPLNLTSSTLSLYICKVADIIDCWYESVLERKMGNNTLSVSENSNDIKETIQSISKTFYISLDRIDIVNKVVQIATSIIEDIEHI